VLPGDGVVCLLVKEGVVCGTLHKFGTDENNMTMPTTTRKICAFFFTGLDLSDFKKERNIFYFASI